MVAHDPETFFRERIQRKATAQDYRRFIELLWNCYSQEVFLYAHAKLRNLEDARDICQDTFLKAIQWLQRREEQVPATVNFPAWLRRIARNLIIDRFRRPALIDAWSQMEHDPYGDGGDWTEQGAWGPVEQASHREQLDMLYHCINRLPEVSRRILMMCDLDGDSYEAIARQVHMPRNTVGVVLHRARKQLRDCVELHLAQCGE